MWGVQLHDGTTRNLARPALGRARAGMARHTRSAAPRAACLIGFVVVSLSAGPALAYERRPHPHAGNATARISASASATYFGTPQLVADGCGNDLTCGPASCTRVADPACSLGSKTNITEAAMQRLVSAVTSRTCTPSADARCSSAALAAVFGRFPAVKAAYCNDAFLVLHSTDLPSHPSTLGAIQSPPGGDETPRCVTRGYVTAQYAFKVPLAPQALPTSDGLLNNAGAFPSEALDNLATLNSATNMPTSGPAAVSVSGIPWFPSFNNRGLLTWGSCEVDVCNAHAGKGFDYHYHGDPFGPQCMYSAANYSTLDAHPPLVGYGADGFPIFGRYLSAAAAGYGVSLDECGGHTHPGMADAYVADNTYHYHAFVESFSSSPVGPFTAYAAGPYMCWKGNISAVENFWIAGGAGGGSQTAYGAGNLANRADYVQLQPCTGTTAAYLASGYTLSGVSSTGGGGGGGGGGSAPPPPTAAPAPPTAAPAPPTAAPAPPSTGSPGTPPAQQGAGAPATPAGASQASGAGSLGASQQLLLASCLLTAAWSGPAAAI